MVFNDRIGKCDRWDPMPTKPPDRALQHTTARLENRLKAEVVLWSKAVGMMKPRKSLPPQKRRKQASRPAEIYPCHIPAHLRPDAIFRSEIIVQNLKERYLP